MRHRSCLGDRSNAYSLGKIVILEGATVAQEAYLCTGTHDFNDPSLQLTTSLLRLGKILSLELGRMILPGVHIGNRAIVGAMSVVSKDIPDHQISSG